MTTVQITQFQSEFATSTSSSAYRCFTANTPRTTGAIDCFVIPSLAVPTPRRVRRGSPTSRITAREAIDAGYAQRMQDARRELAEDMLGTQPMSLSKLRLQRGLSQTQLANMVRTSQPHIAKIEAGTGKLYWDTVVRIADALGVSLDEVRPLVQVQEVNNVVTSK